MADQKKSTKEEKQKFLDQFDRLATKLETKIEIAINILKSKSDNHETKSTS